MAEQEVAEQEEWTHDTMIEGLWRTPEKKEISILYERQDKSRYSGQALEDSREWKDFFTNSQSNKLMLFLKLIEFNAKLKIKIDPLGKLN